MPGRGRKDFVAAQVGVDAREYIYDVAAERGISVAELMREAVYTYAQVPLQLRPSYKPWTNRRGIGRRGS